ncbi:MAG: NYN domain-containing protein, partial [Candidatus Cloacimonetes bacterium]|nr:NYN domain-containing protein [Candidatus Cloacimonadota bacterium]
MEAGSLKVGVYVDVSNIQVNGGFGMHYDVLREFAARNNGVAMRLNAYVAFDEEEAKANQEYNRKSKSFHASLRDFGYKVIVKKVKWFRDEKGQLYAKANADLDMAVDVLMQS